MILIKDSIVYCDANFLVAYGAKAAKQPEKQKRARVLFAQLLASRCKIIASPLTFDEAWLGMRRELGPKVVFGNFRFTISKLVDKVGMRLKNSGTSEFSYSEIFNDLNLFTNRLLDHKNFSVIQFNNTANGVKNALKNINYFKPRDAFHLAIMNDNSATHLISNDSDFIRNKNRISADIINF